jgi:hypothetical protein
MSASSQAPQPICITNLRHHRGVQRISGNLPGRGASRDCGATAQKRIQRRCRKAMNAEHADASVRLQDRRSRIRYRRTRVAGIEPQAEPRPSPHPRVLRASPCCICVEILALRCRGPMLAHPLPGPRRRTRFWRYTLAQRVYSARFGCGQRLRCLNLCASVAKTTSLLALPPPTTGVCASTVSW